MGKIEHMACANLTAAIGCRTRLARPSTLAPVALTWPRGRLLDFAGPHGQNRAHHVRDLWWRPPNVACAALAAAADCRVRGLGRGRRLPRRDRCGTSRPVV
jgi:hypothetical protein